MLELIVLSVVSVGAGSCFVALLPRIAAKCFSDVLGHLIKDASVRELVREVVTDVRDTNEEVASLFFKGKMREELMSVMVEVIGHEKFGANVSFMASRCMADDFLTHTISEGVQESLEDTSQREPIKSLMIEAMMDAKLQGALIKASTNTLKTGIKQALGDEELRADLTLIIREALQDERIRTIVRTVATGIVADPMLHRAAIAATATALNPFQSLNLQVLEGMELQRLRASGSVAMPSACFLDQRAASSDELNFFPQDPF